MFKTGKINQHLFQFPNQAFDGKILPIFFFLKVNHLAYIALLTVSGIPKIICDNLFTYLVEFLRHKIQEIENVYFVVLRILQVVLKISISKIC